MENDKKHTPGPWKIVGSKGYDGTRHYCVFSEDGVLLGNACARGAKQRKADARLMAAAPELLDALKEAVLENMCTNHISYGDREEDCPNFIREEWRCTSKAGECFVQRWLAAIRKAEGLK